MTSEAPSTPSAKISLKRKLLFMLVAGVPLAILGGEAAVRVRMRVNGEPYNAHKVRTDLAELRSRQVDSVPLPGGAAMNTQKRENERIVHPFVATDSMSTFQQLDEDLARYTEKDPDRLVILVLGGSVASLFGPAGQQRLRALLNQHPDLANRNIEFTNYGRGGHKQPQQLTRFSHLMLAGIRPDLVLNIDGFNEVALGSKNHYQEMYPTYPSYTHWMRFARSLSKGNGPGTELADVATDARDQLVAQIDFVLDHDFLQSALYGYYATKSVRHMSAAYGKARTDYMEALKDSPTASGVLGPKFDGDLPEAIRLCVDTWMESSRQIQTLCDMYGIKYVHVLQPNLHDPGAKQMTAEEKEKGTIGEAWLRGVFQGYPLLREGGQQLAAEGIEFIDATMVFSKIKTTIYYDSCHFRDRGNQILAEGILPGALRVLGLKPFAPK